MIDKKDFEGIKKEMISKDEQREAMIKDSRDMLKLSKKTIYSIHRDDLENAKKLLSDIKDELDNLNGLVTKSPELKYSGSYKAAIQEYVEAEVFYSYVVNDKIPTCNELGVSCEHYLLGLCDLTGELVRLAVNSSIKEEFDKVIKIKEFVVELYGMMLEFDFRNGELRKKFDSIKWDLNKLEDLVYNIKLRK